MSRGLFVLLLVSLSACTFSSVPVPTAEKVGVDRSSKPAESGGAAPGEDPAGAVFVPGQETAKTYRVIAEHLNVRTSPGWNWSVCGWLNEGDVVQVQREQGGWGFIGSGWVSLRYLELVE
jgi:uncharacterized protein YgiM (DUF1202 family)